MEFGSGCELLSGTSLLQTVGLGRRCELSCGISVLLTGEWADYLVEVVFSLCCMSECYLGVWYFYYHLEG